MRRRWEDIIEEMRSACSRPGLNGFLRRAAPAVLAVGMGCAYGGPFERESQHCSDGVDNDNNGAIDCEDAVCADQEVCMSCVDGVDNDNDGNTDCDDESCESAEVCGSCEDGVDDDHDGRIDCADLDCQQSPSCQSGAGGAG